jgi:hypothetical protein
MMQNLFFSFFSFFACYSSLCPLFFSSYGRLLSFFFLNAVLVSLFFSNSFFLGLIAFIGFFFFSLEVLSLRVYFLAPTVPLFFLFFLSLSGKGKKKRKRVRVRVILDKIFKIISHVSALFSTFSSLFFL